MIIAPPPGPAYSLIVDLYTYPGAWVNCFVAAGLIYLRCNTRERWSSPFTVWLPVAGLFLMSNMFLAIVPFVPPRSHSGGNLGYPFYVFPVVGVTVLLLGGLYWAIWAKLAPRLGHYRLEAQTLLAADGTKSVRYVKVKE